MPDGKFLKCPCAHCGGHIEFPAEGIGATIPCPHCGRETELTLETPPNDSSNALRGKKWIIAGAIILVIGIVGVIGALVMAKSLMRKSQQRAAQPAVRDLKKSTLPAPAPRAGTVINDFTVLPVAIEKKPGSTLVYATGIVRNETDKQRFGVTVEIDLLDGTGVRIGSAKDYKDTVEPRAEWKFRALLVVKNVAAARVSAVREQ